MNYVRGFSEGKVQTPRYRLKQQVDFYVESSVRWNFQFLQLHPEDLPHLHLEQYQSKLKNFLVWPLLFHSKEAFKVISSHENLLLGDFPEKLPFFGQKGLKLFNTKNLPL